MSGIRQQCACMRVCTYMHACVCVCVPPARSLAHPNTSRLITKRESESGSRGSNSSFHQRRTKDGVFPLSSSSPPPPRHFSLSFLFFFSTSSFLLLLPPHPQLLSSVGRVPQPYSHFPGPWRDSFSHSHTHTSPPPPSPHCAACGKSEGREGKRKTRS